MSPVNLKIALSASLKNYFIFIFIFRCPFIRMGYFLHAVARTHSFYDDIVVKLPIIIEPMVSTMVIFKSFSSQAAIDIQKLESQ